MKDKNVISKVLNIFMNVFIVVLGLVLLISIYNIIQVKVLKNDKSSFFGYSLFEVTSGSMSPEIEKGDWIIVKYKDDIEVGDIVTFKDEKNYITHRVVAKYNEVYTTRGDANNVNDDSIVKEQIVGVVVKILPCFGIFRATIFNPYVLIALIVTLYIVNLVFKKDQETSNKVIDNVIKNILIKIRKFINDKLLKNNKTKNVTNDVINNDSVSITQVNNDSINDKESLSIDQNYDFFADSSPISYESENFNNETIEVDENFDKTMYFRMVKVDKKDLDSPKIDEIDEVVETKEQDDLNIVNETEAEKNLKILYSKRKKFQNIIDKAMFMKGEELEELIDVLNENAKLTTNEATIREILIQNYIDGKYYNYCGNVNVEYDGRNINSRLSQAIDAFSNDLIDSYKGNDKNYSLKVNKYSNYLHLILYIEFYYNSNLNINDKRKNYKNKILKFLNSTDFSAEQIDKMVNDILKIQNKYKNMLKYVINKLDTNVFKLKYNQLSKKNLESVLLEHNINFSNVYSDYIIDKTYSDGIIAENKIEVLLNLLLIQLLKNMYIGTVDTKYIIYINEDLYSKVNKLVQIFKIIEDEYAKNNIIILVRYEKLFENKKNIVKLINAGYKFATDARGIDNALNESIIQMMEYIFVDKNDLTDKYDKIDDSLKEKILYDDIDEKVGGYWSE